MERIGIDATDRPQQMLKDATPQERDAVQILWENAGHQGHPGPEDEARLLASVRQNATDQELAVLALLNRKLAKPPRSGLWSNLFPRGIAWLIILIVATLVFIFVVIGLFGRAG